jgi:hypothetical protein
LELAAVEIACRLTAVESTAAAVGPGVRLAAYFRVHKNEAAAIAKAVGDVVATWHNVADRHGLNINQIDRMASAFEHEQTFGGVGDPPGQKEDFKPRTQVRSSCSSLRFKGGSDRPKPRTSARFYENRVHRICTRAALSY